jgi:hypothetical protein
MTTDQRLYTLTLVSLNPPLPLHDDYTYILIPASYCTYIRGGKAGVINKQVVVLLKHKLCAREGPPSCHAYFKLANLIYSTPNENLLNFGNTISCVGPWLFSGLAFSTPPPPHRAFLRYLKDFLAMYSAILHVCTS